MDSMELNKGIAAVLVAGIAFFVAGTIGDNLVSVERPAKPVLDIKGTEAPAASAPAAPQLPPIAPLLAKADPAAGEATAKKLCTSCHTFTEGGKAGVGPNLYGVVGGPHAHMEGFNYTAGLKAKEGPWTFPELNEWLHQPSSYVKGTRMAFAGIKNDQERANVIDYLRTLSKNPEPLPPVEAAAPPAPAPGGAAAPAGSGSAPPASSNQKTGASPAPGGSASAPATPAAPGTSPAESARPGVAAPAGSGSAPSASSGAAAGGGGPAAGGSASAPAAPTTPGTSPAQAPAAPKP